jgi:hypothetical protein
MRLPGIIATLILVSSCKGRSSIMPAKISGDTTIASIKKALKVDSNLDVPDGKIIKFTSKYSFETFKTNVFIGNLASPDFARNEFLNDKEYVNFITEGCKKNGINFGGHYTIIQRFCGAMCSHIFIIDRISGKIFTDISPSDGRYGYFYKKDSRLLLANSKVFLDDSLKYYNNFFGVPELYVWKDNNFKRLE